MFSTAEDRWERIAQGLFVTGCLFLVFTAYGVYSGDDWRGVVMTLVPGGIMFGLWYMARSRAEYLLTGVKMPLAARVIALTVVLAGVAFAIHLVRMAPQLEIVTKGDRAKETQTDQLNRMMKNLEVVDGKLQRKAPEPERECAEWGQVTDQTEGHVGEVLQFCKRWATEQQ